MHQAVKVLLAVALIIVILVASTAGMIVLVSTVFRDGFAAVADDAGLLNRYADV